MKKANIDLEDFMGPAEASRFVALLWQHADVAGYVRIDVGDRVVLVQMIGARPPQPPPNAA